MRHKPDRHSPALDFDSGLLNRMRNPILWRLRAAERPRDRTLGSYVVAAFAPQQLILL